ncbi:MAG: prepilin-type N-terminal cleavage/methylation domain-containing protein [Chloroflexi bacterium]|jgi:prepilin-type N-terminal cleavage/methylation domain-containing protein|nr:prepilin-type N-terminal cleavage/methylation domain-containing protein [Chloroflexota bacterium]
MTSGDRARGCHRRSEAGFSLIEVLVAFTVLAIAFVAIEGGAIGSITASVTAGQRSTATGLAAQAMAEAQALPFACLEKGLDTNLQTASSSWPKFIVPNSEGSYNLELPNANGTTTNAGIILDNNVNSACALPPLVPFGSVQHPGGGISYDVAVFPTVDPTNSNLVTVTALVRWSAPPSHQQITTVQQVEVGVQ